MMVVLAVFNRGVFMRMCFRAKKLETRLLIKTLCAFWLIIMIEIYENDSSF